MLLCTQTLSKVNTSPRWTVGAGHEFVWFRQSSLYNFEQWMISSIELLPSELIRTLNTLTHLFPPIILWFLSLFVSLHINSWPPSLPSFRTCFFCFLFIPLASAHYMTMPHMYHQYSCVFVQFILIIYIFVHKMAYLKKWRQHLPEIIETNSQTTSP